jgi:acyl-CoA reductase-like NAD-dependent aldehyde dehydrogenase
MSATQSRDLPDPAHGTHAPIAEAEYLRVWLTEIRAGWEAAREEAQSALDAWRAAPGTTTYAVYRAAADRADAAQDELADALRAAGSTQHAASKP